MKILVTGAKGMLGQDLCPVLEDAEYDVIETGKDTLDIVNVQNIKEVFSSCEPDFVIHCAAYTNVDKAEEEKEQAFLINAQGTENIASECRKLNIPLMYISTDYVFDGEKKGKYLPSDAANPINVYGASKLAGENAAKKNEKYYIVRTSWLYGHHGKNFVETMLSLKDTPGLKAADDQIGCPSWTMDVSDGILKIIEENMPCDIYHLCGSGHTSRLGFAEKIFELAGIDVKITPCKAEEFKRSAKRPQNSVMDNNRMLRRWEAALKNYMELRCE